MRCALLSSANDEADPDTRFNVSIRFGAHRHRPVSGLLLLFEPARLVDIALIYLLLVVVVFGIMGAG